MASENDSAIINIEQYNSHEKLRVIQRTLSVHDIVMGNNIIIPHFDLNVPLTFKSMVFI